MLRSIILCCSVFIMFSQFSEAQNVSCGQTIFDLQGISANYLPGEISTDTIYAGVGESLILTFSLLDLADGDTLRIYDTSISDSNAFATFTFGDTSTTIQSWGNTLVLFFKADSTFESEGWEASVTCTVQQFANLSLPIDSLCAGIEVIAPFQILAPLPDSLFVEAFLSDENGSFLNPTPIGEGFTADTTLFIQLAADLPSGNNYKIRLLIQDSTGIEFQQDISIVVSRPPNQPIIIGPGYFCGETISLSAEMQDRTNFTWIYQGDSIPSVIIPQLQTNQAGTYEVIAENFCGSVFSSSFQLLQIPVPLVPQIVSSTQLICNDDTASISLISDGDNSIFQWVFNGLELNDSSQTIQTTQPGNYYCIRSNQCGISISDTITIEALQSPSSETIIALGDLNICQGDSLQLNISTANNQIFWFRDSLPFSQGDSAISVSQSGLYTATLQNACGETNSSNSIQVDTQLFPLVPQISSSKVLICNDDTASISLISDGDNSIFQWVFNGLELNDSSQTIQTTQPGNYYCIRSNQCGISISDTITIEALQSPSSETIIALGDLNICQGDSLQLNISTANNQVFWFRDSLPFSQGDSSISVSQSGLYTATLQNACGETNSSNSIQVDTQLFPLVPQISSSKVLICNSDTASISLISDGDNSIFQWFFNGLELNDSSQTIQTTQPGNYYCIRNNQCGISISDTITIDALQSPSSETIIALGDLNICQGDSLQLNISTANNQIFWFRDSLPFSQGDSAISVSQSGIYTATLQNACGETNSSNSIQVDTQLFPLVPQISSSKVLICNSDTASISIVSDGDNSIFQWVRNGVELPESALSFQTIQPGNYYCIRNNQCGFSISDTITIDALQSPSSETIIALGDLNICQGDSLQLNISTANNQVFWFRDSLPFSQGDSSISVSQSGLYTATLQNACGETNSSNSIQADVQLFPLPASLNAAGPTTLCEGSSVLLLADVPTNDQFQWFLNNSPVSSNAGQLSASESGVYSIVSSNSCGATNSSNSVSVTINPLPEVPLLYSFSTPALCNGSSVTLAVQAQQGALYSWKKNGAIFPGNTNSISTNQSGAYTVSVINGCGSVLSENSISVTSGSAPLAPSISAAGATTFCLGGSVTLNTSPQQGVLYRWIRNGFETVGTNFSLQATQSGSYKVEVSNACDTLISSSTIQLNVIQVPIQVQINPSGEQSICSGDSLSLSIPTVSGVSYQWKFNNDPLSFNTNSIDVFEEGNYTIVLANTCGQTPASNTVYLNVDSIPPASSEIVAQPGTALCPGGYVLLNAEQVPYQLYSWYLNGSLLFGQQNPVLQATEWGTYTLQTKNACGISDTSAGVTLGPGDPPSNFELYTAADTTFCSNDSLQITAQTTFGVSVRWFLNDVLLVDGPSQIYAHTPGVYSANSWNGCGEAQATNTLNLITIPAPEIPIIVFTNGLLQTNAIGTLQWLNSTMEEIAGADSTTFLPEQTIGTFYVRVTNENGCSEISTPFQYSVIGLDEVLKSNFLVYPNPTTDLIFIKSNESAQFQLRDITGRFIQTISIIGNSEKSISLSDLNPGVYLLGHSGFWKRIIVN